MMTLQEAIARRRAEIAEQEAVKEEEARKAQEARAQREAAAEAAFRYWVETHYGFYLGDEITVRAADECNGLYGITVHGDGIMIRAEGLFCPAQALRNIFPFDFEETFRPYVGGGHSIRMSNLIDALGWAYEQVEAKAEPVLDDTF